VIEQLFWMIINADLSLIELDDEMIRQFGYVQWGIS
jgi:hypothetical protein